MTIHKIGTREPWLKARIELLEAEKKLTRHRDQHALAPDVKPAADGAAF